MAKKIPEQFDPAQHPGTYQTGVPEEAEKQSNSLVMILLVIIILLGGIISALGLVNVRLVGKLLAQEQSKPMNMLDPSTSASLSGELLPGNEEPSLPANATVSLTLQAPPVSEGAKTSAGDIYAQNRASLVKVLSSSHSENCVGSGVILDAQGFILTNAHVVESAGWIYVELSDGRCMRAALVGADALTDLAVLYIQAENLTPVQLGDTRHMLEDDRIFAFDTLDPDPGCPLSFGSAISTKRKMTVGIHQVKFLQTDVGSYDGPVFNEYGQLVGMNIGVAGAFFDMTVEADAGYAIPSATIKRVVESIIISGRMADRQTLGVRVEAVSKLYQQWWGIPAGLRITRISAQNPNLQEGDILMALDGQRVTSTEQLHKLLFSQQIGRKMTAVIYRNEEMLTLEVTILNTGA